MNKAYLKRMSGKELDEYAKAIGIDTTKFKTENEKINHIERRRGRIATIDCLGIEFKVPIKRLHDKNLIERVPKPDSSDAETLEFIKELLGEEQLQKLEKACTDDDGVVDIDAFSFAFAKIITSNALKNF